MKFLRTISLIALAVALGVGVLAGDAEAAVLDSVRVATPATGGVVGIDSMIVAHAYLTTSGTPADSSVAVLFWIARSADEADALIDSVGARSAAEDSLFAVWGVGAAFPAGNFVSAAAYIGSSETGPFVASDPATITFTPGVAAGEYVATVSIPIPEYKVDEVADLTVWATVYDPATITADPPERGYHAPVAADTWFAVDGVRPYINPMLVTLQSVNGTGPVAHFVQTATPDTLRVLGVGDTVQVVYDLGPSWEQVPLDLQPYPYLVYDGSRIPLQAPAGISGQQIGVIESPVWQGMAADVAADGQPGYVELYLADPAGNWNCVMPGGPAAPLTRAADFLVDATSPVLVPGDIYPAAGDTLTDGGLNTAEDLDDLNPFSYLLRESLAALTIAFDSADDTQDRVIQITSAQGGSQEDPAQFAAGGLGAGAAHYLDMSRDNGTTTVDVVDAAGNSEGANVADIQSIGSGAYSVTMTATDLAGNIGPALTIGDVYLDVDDIVISNLSPTKAAFGPVDEARVDTLNASSAAVTFQLSEPAAYALVRYLGIDGPDVGWARTLPLVGTELTTTDAVQTVTVPSLEHGTTYALNIIARDLAGNYMITEPDTFLYDTTYVVPLMRRFVVTSDPAPVGGVVSRTVGESVSLAITADAALAGQPVRPYVKYAHAAMLDVAEIGGRGTSVTVVGNGVTDLGGGRWMLDAAGWVGGQRMVVLTNTTAVNNLTVAVSDSSDAANPYVGSLDGTILYSPAPYVQIVVDAPAEVDQGDVFTVDVTLADVYGNQCPWESRYVSIITDKIGIEAPGSMYVEGGKASFSARAVGWYGEGLTFRANDLVDANTGANIRDGVSDPVTVNGGAAIVDAPDMLDARDYMGADGMGDQGGFVLLTWDLSADHANLSGYRIYREMMVDTRAGGEGEDPIVTLPEPQLDWVVWGKVDAVPGETVGRAVVATLDYVATRWAVAAEMNGASSASAKEAFDGVESLGSAYDLMAQTMVRSKTAAQLLDGPVFAALSPEALAFARTGVVPQLRSVASTAVLSALTITPEAVASVDNIAPEPVGTVRAIDTPNDAGASITVSWLKSQSDALVPRNVPSAVGVSLGDYTAGVLGYNVYRQPSAGEATLIGRAGAGETSFVDATVANGVHYTYLVRPFDSSNEAEAVVTPTAMAIRNNVFDASGARLFGLFGADNTVGFDDYFLLADQFGSREGEVSFEPAFDLVADQRVDFSDLLAFADEFGKVAATSSGRTVPVLNGQNEGARLNLTAGDQLPAVGSEVVVGVDLADFAEVKAYGLNVSFDPAVLEFVRAEGAAGALGGGELASAQVISQRDGEVAVGAYGQPVSSGDLGISLVFRTKAETEGTYIEVTDGMVRDASFGLNEVALPAALQIQTRPEAYALANNYPNPFNPATTIKYALPEAAFVQLEVFNVVGQMVRTLVADQQSAGRYVVQWDATDGNGQALSSGIYFYRLQAGEQFLAIRKMLLLK